MIKELILAVTLGALLGFGLTGGYLAVKKNGADKSAPAASPTASVSGAPQAAATITPAPNSDQSKNQITLDSPENESVVSNSQITVKGSTNQSSYVVISTPIKTYFVTADNSGNFTQSVEIESGINQIQIDSIDLQDNQATLQIMVTYSTAKF